MALRTISLIRGDTDYLNLVFKRSDGTPYCIKNWSVFFTLKSDINVTDAQASLQKIVTAFPDTTSGTSGSAQIVINPSDTSSLDPNIKYEYDISITTNLGEQFTVLKGQVEIIADVTQTTGTAGTAA